MKLTSPALLLSARSTLSALTFIALSLPGIAGAQSTAEQKPVTYQNAIGDALIQTFHLTSIHYGNFALGSVEYPVCMAAYGVDTQGKLYVFSTEHCLNFAVKKAQPKAPLVVYQKGQDGKPDNESAITRTLDTHSVKIEVFGSYIYYVVI